MKFFDQQLVKRRHSVALLVCFLAALLVIALAIHVSVAVLSYLTGDPFSLSRPSLPALLMISLIWSTALAGGFFRSIDLRAGPAVLARRFGAVRASDRNRFDKEKILLNVVAEVAIASSTQQPDVYVLRNENSINAFVLGAGADNSEERRHVIVVTQGALDAFDRYELQAVIAHEFAHIANDDLRINMQLLIVLGGLMAIDEVGRLLVGRDPGKSFFPFVVVGFLFRGLGVLGVLLGQLISAAFSRQREYLADATAVQFTRKPYALASALHIIRTINEPRALHLVQAKELTHLCFQGGREGLWYQAWMSTHPPIESRIHQIDPYFKIKRRKERPEKKLKSASSTGSPGLATGGVAVDNGPGELSDQLQILLSGETQSLAALFALFVSEDEEKRRTYLTQLSMSYNLNFTNLVEQLSNDIRDELKRHQLLALDQIAATLKNSVSLDNRQRLLKTLESLLRQTHQYNLVNYASMQLVRRKLDVDFPMLKRMSSDKLASGKHIKEFNEMGDEFALLLSLMIESSGADQAKQQAEFERVLKCYTQVLYPRRTANESGIVADVESAFQTLYMQPKPIRQAFVQHCIEIAQSDGYVDRAERALLHLFAASLGCEDLAA